MSLITKAFTGIDDCDLGTSDLKDFDLPEDFTNLTSLPRSLPGKGSPDVLSAMLEQSEVNAIMSSLAQEDSTTSVLCGNTSDDPLLVTDTSWHALSVHETKHEGHATTLPFSTAKTSPSELPFHVVPTSSAAGDPSLILQSPIDHVPNHIVPRTLSFPPIPAPSDPGNETLFSVPGAPTVNAPLSDAHARYSQQSSRMGAFRQHKSPTTRGLSEQQQRAKIEKMRQSARDCRKRKKAYVQSLHQKCHDYDLREKKRLKQIAELQEMRDKLRIRLQALQTECSSAAQT